MPKRHTSTNWNDLSLEIIDIIVNHVAGTHNLVRVGGVCRDWRASLHNVLRKRIEKRGGAASAALSLRSTCSMMAATPRLCLLDSIGAAQMASSVMSAGDGTNAVVDAQGRLLVWGKGPRFSAEADPIINFSSPTVVHAGRIVSVSTGGYPHVLALTAAGEVLSFGRGKFGQLGHGDRKDQRLPKVIDALRGVHVVAIATGCHHSMVLTIDGKVLSCGAAEAGENGHGSWRDTGEEEDQLVPKEIEALKERCVVAIAAKMVLTDKGEVLTFGGSRHGYAGALNDPTPEVVATLPGTRVVAIAAGGVHDLLLADTGDVLSFGTGSSGQLGHGVKKDELLQPKVIEKMRGVRVVAISAGLHHSLVLTDCGKVFLFGTKWYKRSRTAREVATNVSEYEYQLEPELVEVPDKKRVVAISAGYRHSLLLTSDGDVLSFGLGMNGQLGHGDEVDQRTPKPITEVRVHARADAVV